MRSPSVRASRPAHPSGMGPRLLRQKRFQLPNCEMDVFLETNMRSYPTHAHIWCDVPPSIAEEHRRESNGDPAKPGYSRGACSLRHPKLLQLAIRNPQVHLPLIARIAQELVKLHAVACDILAVVAHWHLLHALAFARVDGVIVILGDAHALHSEMHLILRVTPEKFFAVRALAPKPLSLHPGHLSRLLLSLGMTYGIHKTIGGIPLTKG